MNQTTLLKKAYSHFSAQNYEVALDIFKELKRTSELDIYDFNIDLCVKRLGTKNSAGTRTHIEYEPLPENRQFPKDRWPNSLRLPKIIGKGNDYSHIEKSVNQAISENQESGQKVSIVIPTFNRPKFLDYALAALTVQSFDMKNAEVIVADDGSQEDIVSVVKRYEDKLNIRYVRQPDNGYRLSQVRNLGVRVATHPNIILLDCDLIPSRDFVYHLMIWFDYSTNVAIMAHRHFVDIKDVSIDEILRSDDYSNLFRPVVTENKTLSNSRDEAKTVDWRMKQYENNDFLKSSKYPFRFFAAGHVAFTKQAWSEVGGFEEEFTQWGCEDLEFGYKLFREGIYIVPEMRAIDYHCEPESGVNETDRTTHYDISKELLFKKCPLFWRQSNDPAWTQFRNDDGQYDTPLVSILMPAYNAEKFIGLAIQSVIDQDYNDWEMCIVNDGSTDSTLSIIKEFAAKDSRIRYKSQPNMKIRHTRDAAIKMARGDFIGWLDADDMLMPSTVSECVKALLAAPPEVGVVYTDKANMDDDGNSMPAAWSVKAFSRQHLLLDMIVHHFRMFKYQYWKRTEGFSKVVLTSEDYDQFLKLADVCDFLKLDKILYKYRVHSGNESLVNMKKMHVQLQLRNNALNRMGLNNWEAFIPNPESNPRAVSFRIKDGNKKLIDYVE